MHIITGLPDAERNLAAELYWEAFGEKLGVVMGPREKGLAFVRRVIDPSHAISAIDDTGKISLCSSDPVEMHIHARRHYAQRQKRPQV